MRFLLLLSYLVVHSSLLAADLPKLDFGTVREEHIMIPMRDGKRLSAYVFFPQGKGKWPAIFEQRYTFEALGKAFLGELTKHAGRELSDRSSRIVVGRPVAYAGGSPDPALARQRYDLMFDGFGAELHYVYEPLAAAFTYAARLTDEATVLVADFGGGTSDFSVVHMKALGAPERLVVLMQTLQIISLDTDRVRLSDALDDDFEPAASDDRIRRVLDYLRENFREPVVVPEFDGDTEVVISRMTLPMAEKFATSAVVAVTLKV